MGRFARISHALGVTSTRHALVFGTGCALAGAAVASIVWVAAVAILHEEAAGNAWLEMATIVKEPAPQMMPQTIASDMNSIADLPGDIVDEEIMVPPAGDAGRLDSTGIPKESGTVTYFVIRNFGAPEAENLPTEHHKMILPAYTIEPPDILNIEASRVVAKTPGGMAEMRPISGQHLVAPDGTVNLGTYGEVRVSGLTLAEAKTAIDKQLAKSLDRPDVAINVFAYNSKVYYVVIEGADGDSLVRFPITGNETVLDALAQVRIKNLSSKRIWIARPTVGGHVDKVLRVNWKQISKEAATASNYQLLPGDRVFVSDGFDAAKFLWGAITNGITWNPAGAPRGEMR